MTAPNGVKIELTALINQAAWKQAEAQGYSEVALQKEIEKQVTLITDKGSRLLSDIESVHLVKYY